MWRWLKKLWASRFVSRCEPINFTPPVNTAPSFVVTKHFFDGEPSFWSVPSPKYWVAHSDLYPPAPPPSTTVKRQKKDGTWEEYSISNAYSVPFATNCYPISWSSACAMNGGEPPKTLPFGKNGDMMIVVTDFMRRNYRPRTGY